MQVNSPIILFVYNRPWHTEQTLEALMANKLAKDSTLYIYADGPKDGTSEEILKKIKDTRAVVLKKKWCREVNIIERKKNIGLAANVIDGVTEIVNQYGKIIVLEDDLITSPNFLTYCNKGLEIYENEQNVYSINAYQFPIDFGIKEPQTFLCPLATSSWGWATWKDKWAIFEEKPEHISLIQTDELIKKQFNFGDYDLASMLTNDKSWAIRWYYSVFIRNGLGLFPTHSLVKNIGFDGSGENCGLIKQSNTISFEQFKLVKKNSIDLKLFSLMLSYCSNDKKTKFNKNLKYYLNRLKLNI